MFLLVPFFIGLAGVFAFFLFKSITTGVATLRGGSVTRESSPTMFKVYVLTQIFAVIIFIWMAISSLTE